MTPTARLERHATAISVALLALLAYVPALTSSPGRMPADTKLYLYLDPWGLFGRAASTFEPDQFAGWVPFQQITYLWPSGPWYLLFDALGVPDWIAHRLWIGTIMFLAGAGLRWAARLLGVSALGSLAAAVVYQLSPFLLAYISRTSLLLLPWAGLGWIVALTVRATLARSASGAEVPTWRRRLGAWRDPALIALIVATVGSTNATTLAMIVPAPVLWIIHVTWQRRIGWGAAVAVTARIALACTAVSVWWIAMLSTQSRNGPAVLAYTETLADVSRNATGSEVLRGLGYWLFYQRDPVAATTTASGDYLVRVRVMALSYAVVLVGLLGLVVTAWAQRRFAALCVASGVVLAVGVHPIDDPSPLFSLFVGDESGLALALRSSTRAVPVFLLGIALGAGALVSIVPQGLGVRAGARLRAVPGVRVAATAGVVLLAIANLPSLWQRAFVDPAIDRDQDPPAAWVDAVDRLGSSDPNARVLQVPGAEFGTFRWGYATDHPLVGMTDKPVVTRDLLPLGSPAAMDLLFALDDRIQDGTLEAQSVAPVARLLGADVVWLSNDAAFERFRTARPETVDQALTASIVDGLGPVERFGEPVVNTPEVDMTDPAAIVDPAVGTPRSPVALTPIDDPVGVIRAVTETVVVSGSGDGLIDAAASGLVSGHELTRYSASLAGAELAAALDDGRALIVTDTNRDQAHHWRGSQDVRGHTEPGGSDIDVLVSTTADQRLDVFGSDTGTDSATQTVAIQDGPVTAIASAYGEPFAYRPEDRAVMAIDGDPTTAWRVDDHGDPIGERLRLVISEAVDRSVDRLVLHQAATPPGGRSIAAVRITVADRAPLDVDLTPASFDPSGQLVEIPSARSGDAIDIEITAIVPGVFPTAASLTGVGFSEIDLGLGATTEFVRPPVDGLAAVDAETPLALLFTRWRVDPTDPWREDPEPVLRRRFPLIAPRTVDATATLRLDRGASDEELAALLDPGRSVPVASSRVTGGVRQRGAATVDGDPTTAWVTGFDEAVGARLTFPELGAIGSALLVDQPSGAYSTITELELRRGDGTSVTLPVPAPDAAGRSAIALPAAITGVAGPLELTITAVEPRVTIDRRYGDPRTLPAAIAELTATDGIDTVTTDPARSVSARCSGELLTLDGAAVPLTFTATVGDLLDGAAVEATSCAPSPLDAGSHDLVAAGTVPALVLDRVVLADPLLPAPAAPSGIGVEIVRNDPRARDVVVAPCPAGCWVVLGEGFNDAWSAESNGTTLGPPALVDGGFNGWFLPPSDVPTTVEFRWTAQRPVTIGLTVSALAAIVCLLVAVMSSRRVLAPLPRPCTMTMRPMPRRRAAISGGVLVVASVLLIGPLWGLVAASVALVALWLRRSRTFEMAGIAAAGAVALHAIWVVRRDRPFPNAGWTATVEHLNGLALFAVIVLAVGAAFAGDADREPA